MKGFLLTLLLLCAIALLGWYLIQLWQDRPEPPPEQLVWQGGRCGSVQEGGGGRK
ncbi:MAG TPA: hypothetical protein GX518_04280 [Firmicutes bacterium]|nr:hypothetical protein [Bacillota bacterium]